MQIESAGVELGMPPGLTRMRNDVRFAIRTLLKQKTFTAAAVFALALGLGASTAIYSVVNGVLLRPLPYPEPDRIVTLNTSWRSSPSRGGNTSGADFVDWKQQATSFEAMAWFVGQQAGVKAADVGEFAGVYVVTPEFFEVLRVHPVAGRLFSSEEVKPNGANAILVSASFARSNYGGPGAALGRTVRLASQSFPIVGVMPEGFHYPARNTISADFWVPASWIGEQWRQSRTAHNFSVVARLKAGVSIGRAREEMRTIAAGLERAYPRDDKDKLIAVDPLKETLTANTRSTLQLLMGAVGLLLLLSCANVANMLLARATSRGRELALRAAVGASRGQIIRQLLVESAVLAVLAAGFGAVIAVYGTGVLVAMAGHNLPRAEDVRVDLATLAFLTLCSAGSVFLFGLMPAIHASRIDLNHALRQGGQRSGLGGLQTQRVRNALAAAEIALSVVLTVSAGLLFRSTMALAAVDLGFTPEHLMVMETSVAAKDDAAVQKAAFFYRDVLPLLRAVPGVEVAAGVMGLPAANAGSNGAYEIEGRAATGSLSARPNAGFNVITPRYFDAMKTPLFEGRDFDERDTYQAAGVAIINRAFARREFPDGDAIGKRIRCGLDRDIWMTIVGITGDMRRDSLAQEPEPQIYMPYLQHPWHADELSIVIRARGDLGGIRSAAVKLASSRSADVALRFSTMDTILAESIVTPRFRSVLMLVFAAFAGLVAMAGLYGVVAYSVSRRVPEMGLRIALGATPRDVMRVIFTQSLAIALAGVAAGTVLAIGASRFLRSMLYDITPLDPLTYFFAALGIAVTAVAAAMPPARRAGSVDPVEALRAE